MNCKRQMKLKYVGPLASSSVQPSKPRNRLVQGSNELKNVKLKCAFGTPVERLCVLSDEHACLRLLALC